MKTFSSRIAQLFGVKVHNYPAALSLMIFVASSPSLGAQEQHAVSSPQSTQTLAPLRDLGQELNSDLVRKLIRTPKSEVSLIAFECGTVLVNNLGLFNPAMAGQSKTMYSPCFYIQHSSKGGLIWDTGLTDKLAGLPAQKVLEGALEISVKKTLSEQLSDAGIDPEAVEKMAISHLHFDHTGNMNYFTNAKWLIQKQELELAFSDQAATAGFAPADYNGTKKDNIEALDGHHDVFGDGSVIILSAPGHTVGHQTLLVKLKETGPVILSGDLFHFKENQENYVVPPFNFDKRESISSFAFIDKVLEVTSAALWVQHDPDFYRELKLAPFVYR